MLLHHEINMRYIERNERAKLHQDRARQNVRKIEK